MLKNTPKNTHTKSVGWYLEGKLSLIRGLTVLVCIKSEQCPDSLVCIKSEQCTDSPDSLAPFLWPLH